MKNKPYNLRIDLHAGFSLVEVMVGMVIALLGTIIIFQVFSVSEGIKRTTTSGGDATQNGAMALFMLERSLKQAGYGFLPGDSNVPPDPPVGTKLVDITAGTAAATDSVIVRYRPNWEFGRFQPASGVFTTIAAAIPALTQETFSVDSKGQLRSSVNGVIAEGIAMLKLEYGIDTDLNGTADSWTQTAPPNPLDVWAVRIALVARSAKPERSSVDSSGVCNTTTAYPAWTDSATLPLNLSGEVGLDAANDDWKCYRYKTFESTVALRN